MGIRGKRLFTNLFGEHEVAADGAVLERGRSAELVAARNELLLTRFVYHGADARFKYEYVIKLLVREFFLSESTIGQIIEANGDVLHIVRREFDVKVAREKWGFMRW